MERPNLKKLLDDIENMPERDVEKQLTSLRSSYLVFVGNYTELTRFLNVVEDPLDSVELWDVNKRDKLDVAMQEATRLLHNLLSSAKSLVDHTRVLSTHLYKEHPFISEYRGKIESHFSENPLQCFIRDLRNYVQHYSLPLVSATFEWNVAKGTSNTFLLEIAALIKWDKWSKQGKSFIDELDGNIGIRSIVSAYFNLVEEFYKCLSERQQQIHKEEMVKLIRKREEFNRMVNKSFPHQPSI